MRVLLVEDDPDLRFVIEMMVSTSGADVDLVSVATVTAAQDRGLGKFDMVLSDFNLPGGTGLDVLAWWQRECPEAELVLVTAEVTSRSGFEGRFPAAVGLVDRWIEKGTELGSVLHRLFDDERD